MRDRIPPGLVYLLTALTGAAGLVYQIAWQRYLGRLLGAESLATAVVLGVFLGGLSLGLVVWGRLSARPGNLLATYGALEALVGLWALLFPWIFAAVDTLTASWRFEPPLGLLLQGSVCAVALIGLPTVCMGATVPLLTRALADTLEDATRINARVYAFNTAGAVVGTLVAGYLAIRFLGLSGTVRVAGLVNLAAAAYFVSAGRRGKTRETRVASAPEGAAAADVATGSRAVLYAIVFCGGFAFMTLESLIIRVTGLAVGGSTYSLSLVVAAFLLAIAVGALVVGRRGSSAPSTLALTQLGVCVSLVPLAATLDAWPWAAHVLRTGLGHASSDFVLYQLALFASLFGLLVLPVGLMGATLPLAFDAAKRGLDGIGRSAGALFAWNALGNLTGGLLGGYLLYRFLELAGMVRLVVALTAAGALLAALRCGRGVRRATGIALVVVAGLVGFVPLLDPSRLVVGTFHLHDPVPYSRAGPAGFYREFLRGRNVVARRDEPEATLAVVENPSLAEALKQRFPSLGRAIVAVPSAYGDEGPRPRSILINGKADSSTFYDRETLRLAAHLPALLAARRERAMVVGLGTGVTAGELALYPDVRSIDVAEISPGVARLLPSFGEWTHDVHTDPRLVLHIGDAFRVLGRSTGKWDLVVSEPSNPWTGGIDQLYSREFFRLVRTHLEPDGLFLQWMQRYATNDTIAAIVINTLRAEFPHVRVFRAGSDDLLLASLEPVGARELARVGPLLETNDAVRRSLAEIRVAGAADLLRREHPEVVERAAALERLGYETLDRPRLHFLSGLAFFRGDDPDGRELCDPDVAR